MQDQLLRQLYEAYAFYVFRRCRRMLGSENEAEDAMHDVFVKLLQQPDRPEGTAAELLPWVNRITTNHCLNTLRARRVRRAFALQAASTPADDRAWLAWLVERQDWVSWLVCRCDEAQRAVVVGYFLDELSVEEVAQRESISAPTVRRRLKSFLELARETAARELNSASQSLSLSDPEPRTDR
jgi:RNA polymerase sigma-70 factor (ECF subfamily)